MGLVDLLNGAVLRRLRSGEGPSEAARLMGNVEEIVRLAAVKYPQTIGETLGLVAELHDGTVLSATEHDRGWEGLLVALDRSGKAASSSREWPLRLIGDATTDSLLLIGQEPELVGDRR